MKHGRTAYLKGLCRCEECTAAHREYMRFYRGSKLTGPTPTSSAAYNRALARLVEAHVEELRRLVDDETARELADR